MVPTQCEQEYGQQEEKRKKILPGKNINQIYMWKKNLRKYYIFSLKHVFILYKLPFILYEDFIRLFTRYQRMLQVEVVWNSLRNQAGCLSSVLESLITVRLLENLDNLKMYLKGQD